MSAVVERYQRLMVYERECGAAVVASLASIAAESRSGADSQRAMAIAAHVQAARLEWLWRLTSYAKALCQRPERLFFESMTISAAESMTAEADTAWSGYIDELTDAELSRVASYQNTAGRPHSTRVSDIVTHVFNHATYHRGQVAMLVGRAGGEPAVTDFIFFSYRDPDRA
ncbi:MAG: DinB family protein [Planctomycetota bacterium]